MFSFKTTANWVDKKENGSPASLPVFSSNCIQLYLKVFKKIFLALNMWTDTYKCMIGINTILYGIVQVSTQKQEDTDMK